MDPSLLAYAAIGLSALGLGVLVFVLFPGKRVASEPVGEIHPTLGPVQRSTLGQTLVAAAPRGYTGWLEKQIVFAGRPIGWSPSKIVTWKLVLAIVGVLFGLMFVLVGGAQPLKVIVAVVATLLLFFSPTV